MPGIKQKLAKRRIRFERTWIRFWMRHSGLTPAGRIAMRLAKWFAPHYKANAYLAQYGPSGYVSPSAVIEHSKFETTKNVFVGARTTVFESSDGGPVSLKQGVHLYSDAILETGDGGSITIDEDTHIQPRCSFSGYKGSIRIGKRVEIAPNCAFYPYNHGMEPNEPIRDQPLVSKGDIIVEDDAWLGFGVILLEDVKIGTGAVIGAGSVVTMSIPPGAIAAGTPAKIIGYRNDLRNRDSKGNAKGEEG